MSTFNGWPVYTFPSDPPAPKSIEWRYEDNVGEAKSPFAWKKQLYDWSQAKLAASLSYQMDKDQARVWEGFLAGLRGGMGVFLFGDPLNLAPLAGGATGGAVSGGGQTGRSLITTGSGMQGGDWISIGLRLYRVVSASGGTLEIWPPLRESPTNGAAVVTSNCKGLFRLSSNTRGVSVDDAKWYSITFEIEEAL